MKTCEDRQNSIPRNTPLYFFLPHTLVFVFAHFIKKLSSFECETFPDVLHGKQYYKQMQGGSVLITEPGTRCSAVACVFFVLSRCNLLTEAATHKHTMSKKRHADSTQDENPPKRRQLSADQVLVEAIRTVNTTAVRAVLKKRPHRKTMAFDVVREACRRNDDESLILLLPYVETTQMDFGILLSECVHAYHVACTEVLLQHWKCVCKNTAFVLHRELPAGEDSFYCDFACPAMWSDPAVCRVLIDAGADLHTKDEKQRLPLHYACASGALDVVKMLVVAAGAGTQKFKVADDEGETCLSYAASFGRIETVRYLVGLPEVDVNYADKYNYTALRAAVCREETYMVQVLIDAGADFNILNRDGLSLLHDACEFGVLEIVKILVRAGAGVRVTSDETHTCLHAAAQEGRTEIVRYLVSLPDVDNIMNQETVECNTALHLAAICRKPDVLQVLIDAGAHIDIQDNAGCSPLHSACDSGVLDTVEMLVRAGAEVRATDDKGWTCLYFAARYAHTETVRYLVCLPEVDVNHRDADNYTALHYAVVNVEPDVVQVLIDAGADINTQNSEEGRSPLHSACVRGALDMVEMLVRAGAGVRAKSDDGETCLILAARRGHTETVRYLVGLPEVELNHRDTAKNYTALQYAVEEKHTEVTQVLMDALYVVFGV